ncbi:MAG: hypothetical protein IT174_04260 [Acidobacteria bacterium]|nr:hypothetical protein [Acidobacteriota bacterium]
MAFAARPISDHTIHDRALVPGLVLMISAVVISLIVFALSGDLVDSFPYLYLLPWILGLAVILAAPSVYLYQKGRLKLYDPLVFATWVYLFPSFVVGGLMLAGGWSRPWFISFIEDAHYNLPYTVVLVALGFVGLAAGYFVPLGPKIGEKIGRFLPSRDFDSSAMLVPGLGLLLLGTLNTTLAFVFGIIGYQKSEEIDPFSGTVFLTTLFWMQGSFVLWYVIFRRARVNLYSALIIGLLLTLTVARALFSGNRAALLQVFVLVILAFFLAGGKLNFRRTAIAGTLFSLCLIAGMIYGTTFRNIKGTESRVSIGQYSENITETFDHLSRFNLTDTVELALAHLALRLDTLSSVAVVVSNYEQLAPYEESYGLDNNIRKDLTTFFIPRVLWREKPVASEPRKYSDLYFDNGETSFALTPIGDLIRNFGPVGVPLGMFFFGILIRTIYRSLVEDQPMTTWRITLYFMLLMSISYEGFFAVLIPNLFKVGITATLGLVFMALISRALGHRRMELPT